MARVKIAVDSKELQAAINAAEKTQKDGMFPTRQALFVAVASSEWATSKSYSASILASRFREFNLKAKTKASKPGRPKGSKNKVNEGVLQSTAASEQGQDIEAITDAGDEPDLD